MKELLEKQTDAFADETTLVKALAANDAQAFNYLMAKYKDMVYRICYGFVRNAHDAEDLAQDVFVQVYFAVKQFRQEASLSTWLYRIAVNKSLNHINRVASKNKNQSIDELPFDKVGSNAPDPHGHMEHDQRRAVLYAAIDTLPESQRSAFTLHNFEDLSYREIAEIMDTSLASVESLIHRAKNNLQKKLVKVYKNLV